MRGLEFSIAWRYLRSRRGSRLLSLISVIAIGGVVLGVSALIVIMGVMNGLQRDMRDKILIASPDIRALPYGAEMRLADWSSVRAEVSRIPGVVAAAPFVQTQGLVRNLGGSIQTGAQVVGIEAQGINARDVTSIRTHAILGDFRFQRDGVALPGAVLGKSLATKLSAFPGDTIVLLGQGDAQMNASTGALIPRVDSVVVSGVFETGMYEYDDLYLFLELSMAQRFAALDKDVTGIEIRTADRWDAAGVAELMRDSVRSPVRFMDWQEQNQQLFQALKLEKLGMGVILLLIVVVAAFNIVSTLTMVVADKTREIGILRAMGMPGRSIRRIFLWQGVVIGALGTVGGLVLGITVAVLLERYHLISLDPKIYFIDHLPVYTDPIDVIAIVAASLAIAALATLYPASQAAKLYPVEAIRHE
ncbi:MAG: ABC transporter permease [Gemmatimonadaceae bacterium]|nr:ABC transporter permease [Gemmatimonadaceae bacterium]